MKALASASFLFLVACQSSHLHLLDGGTRASDTGTKGDESCGDLQTDNNNCGSCGNLCSALAPSTAQCVMGRCLTTLLTQDRVPSFVVAHTGVYWLNTVPAADGGSTPALWRAGLDGGAPSILTTKCGYCYKASPLAANNLYCTPLIADATNLYCTRGYGDNDYVARMPLDGSSEPAFLTGGDWFSILELALDASNLYWSTCYKDSYIKMSSLDGAGKPSEVAWNGPSCPSNLVPHDYGLYWLGNSAPSEGGDTTSLLKTSMTQNGAKPIPLLDWNKNWGRFAVGDAAIYWTDPDQGAVMALPLDGGNSPSPIITGLDSPQDLAVDAGHVYWASRNGGTILKLSLSDSALTVLATGQNRPHGIAIDPTSVYWISTDGGRDTIMKVSPK